MILVAKVLAVAVGAIATTVIGKRVANKVIDKQVENGKLTEEKAQKTREMIETAIGMASGFIMGICQSIIVGTVMHQHAIKAKDAMIKLQDEAAIHTIDTLTEEHVRDRYKLHEEYCELANVSLFNGYRDGWNEMNEIAEKYSTPAAWAKIKAGILNEQTEVKDNGDGTYGALQYYKYAENGIPLQTSIYPFPEEVVDNG